MYYTVIDYMINILYKFKIILKTQGDINIFFILYVYNESGNSMIKRICLLKFASFTDFTNYIIKRM